MPTDERKTSLSARTLAKIRRARVAAGWTLEQVAQRSRIPLNLLQELESGDISRWPAGLYGRIQLVRYARASTLDPEVVVAAVSPLLNTRADPGGTCEALPVREASPVEPEGIRIIALEFRSDDELFASEEAEPPIAEARPEPELASPPIAAPPRHEEPQVQAHPRALKPVSAPTKLPRPTAAVSSADRRIARAILVAGAATAVALGAWAAFLIRPAGAPRERPAAHRTMPRAVSPVEEPAPRAAASETEVRVEPDQRRRAAAAAEPPADQPNRSPITAADPVLARAPTPEMPSADSGAVPASGRRESMDIGSAPQPNTTARRAEGLPADAALYSPTFAPVGNAIFYHARRANRSALMRADTDGAGFVLRVTPVVDDEARNFHARPSPDGRQIAFDSDREGQRSVYIADADGRHARRVSGDGYAAVPSWSPDGRSLVFVKADPARPRVWNLWQLMLASGGLRQLTSHRYGQPWGGSWFPDGRRLAYSHEDRIVVLDLPRGTRRVYASPRPGRLLRTPAVSPDGRHILFQVFGDGAWLLDVSSGSMRKILDDRSAEEYAWSPDGRRVAYHSRRSGQWGVWTMAMQ